jgi:hypothetical protein
VNAVSLMNKVIFLFKLIKNLLILYWFYHKIDMIINNIKF